MNCLPTLSIFSSQFFNLSVNFFVTCFVWSYWHHCPYFNFVTLIFLFLYSYYYLPYNFLSLMRIDSSDVRTSQKFLFPSCACSHTFVCRLSLAFFQTTWMVGLNGNCCSKSKILFLIYARFPCSCPHSSALLKVQLFAAESVSFHYYHPLEIPWWLQHII